MLYKLDVAGSLVTTGDSQDSGFVAGLRAILVRSNHSESTGEDWDFLIEVDDERDRLGRDRHQFQGFHDPERIDTDSTLRLTRLLCGDWNVSRCLDGVKTVDRGVAASPLAIEREVGRFTEMVRDRRAAGAADITDSEPIHRLWAMPGQLRRVAHLVASEFSGVVVVGHASRATITIETQQEVTGSVKYGEKGYWEGREEYAAQVQRINQGVTFVPPPDLIRLIHSLPADAPLDSSYLAVLVADVRSWMLSIDDLERRDDPSEGHVFISYVNEDVEIVSRLHRDLELAGIMVWRDRTSLPAGSRWKVAIRDAISNGSSFICCFSAAYAERGRSYMNEELTLAVEELRLRDRSRIWFLPVVLPGGAVPDWSIGPGETLRDFSFIELNDASWAEAVEQLRASIMKE